MPRAEEKTASAISSKSKGAWWNSIGFVAGLALAISIGTFLRLYLLRDQILVDDEWHGLNYAAAFNSLPRLLTYFSLTAATCIPLNVYEYLLLQTTGWNETLLRLPSIAAGITGLILLPILIRGEFNRRTSLIFAALLSLSPFLIFYSRMARPYSLVTLLGFAAVWLAYLWETKGGKGYAIAFIVLAVLAISFHLFAAIGVMVPLACAFAQRVWNRFKKVPGDSPPANTGLVAITVAAAILIGVSAVFAILGLISSGSSVMMTEDRMTAATFGGFLTMLGGTPSAVCVLLFLSLLGIGLFAIYQEKPLLGNIFASTALCYFGALVLLRPSSINEPIVVARYVILLFPLSFLAVARGVDSTLQYIEGHTLIRPAGRIVANLIGVTFVAVLFLKGPLPSLYSSQNNFTNHCAFQCSYRPLTWEQAPATDLQPAVAAVRRESIPNFYWQLADEPNITIIEFPVPFVDVYNLYYYYQHFHRKRLLVGYVPVPANPVVWIDQAVGFVREPGRLHFRNMVNLEQTEAIRSSGAKYIILHPNLLREWTWNVAPLPPDYSALSGALRDRFITEFGSPVYWDKNIIVFEIR